MDMHCFACKVSNLYVRRKLLICCDLRAPKVVMRRCTMDNLDCKQAMVDNIDCEPYRLVPTWFH